MSKPAGNRFERHPWLTLTVLAVVFTLILDCCLTSLARALLRPRQESSYRIKSALLHHDLKPFADTSGTWGPLTYSIKTNSLGFRDAEPRVVALKPVGRRLLFIGDSFTEGLGYDYEKTSVGLIGRKLAPRGVEVLNAAVASYYPGIYLRKARYLIEDAGLRFDELIVFLDIGDIADETEYEEIDTGNGRSVLKGKDDVPLSERGLYLKLRMLVADHTTVLEFLIKTLGKLRPGYRPATPPSPYGRFRALWTVDEDAWNAYGRVGLEKASRHMDALANLLKSRRIKLTVAVYPWPDQIARRDLPSKQETFWREWSQRNGARFIDYFPSFLGQGSPDEALRACFIPGDVHWNAEGHRRIADGFLADDKNR